MNLTNLMGQDLTLVTGEIKKWVNMGVMVVLSICAAFIVVFAIYIGIQMAKAEDEGARKEAKSRLIYSIIGVVVVALIAALIGPIKGVIEGAIMPQDPGQLVPGVSETLQVVRDFVGVLLDLIVAAGTIFAVYLGWKFMSAESDDKRKNAKMQLLYTIIGIVGIVAITIIANSVMTGLIQQAQNDAAMITWGTGFGK